MQFDKKVRLKKSNPSGVKYDVFRTKLWWFQGLF